MKLSNRFALLSLLTTAIAGVILLVCLLIWEYNSRQSLLLAETRASLGQNSSLSRMLHFQSEAAIGRQLELLLRQVGDLQYAAAYHLSGQIVGSSPTVTPPVAALERRDNARLELVTGYQHSNRPSVSDSFLGSLSPFSNYYYVVSIPILSPVDPMRSDVSFDDYTQRIAADTGLGARFVVGYIDVGLSVNTLFALMSATALQIALWTLLALAVTLAIVRAIGKSIARPLEDIAEVAQAISRDTLPKDLDLPVTRRDEIGDIAKVLSAVLDGMHRIKRKLDVDNSLLAMRADETAVKLNKAEQLVSRSRKQMRQIANFDAVTGLPNRRLMLEQLTMLVQIAARERRRLALLVIEASSLAKINETYGREIADLVVKVLSDRIMNSVRKSDLISREGDQHDVARVDASEFSVLLHAVTDIASAQLTANRILDELKQPIDIEGQTFQLTFSLGLAVAPDHAKRPEELIRAADVALSDAKARSLQFANVYDQSMHTVGSQRFQLEQDLRNADLDKHFELHFQPQVDIERGTVVGAEALVRWHHPDRGPVAPFHFIPIAEESGDIIRIGSWVLNKACETFKNLKREGVPLPKMSINVSAAQIDEQFPVEVAAAIARHGLKPENIQLELTESLLIQDVEKVLAIMRELRHDVGVRLALDDFGTGYSSLAYVAKFPLDELKVDRSFVVAMDQDSNSSKLTAAVLAIGRELSLDLVVEGVDSMEQLNRLQQMGAKVIQGYLFSEPLPVDEFRQFCAAPGIERVLKA